MPGKYGSSFFCLTMKCKKTKHAYQSRVLSLPTKEMIKKKDKKKQHIRTLCGEGSKVKVVNLGDTAAEKCFQHFAPIC